MPDIITDKRITQDEAGRLMAPLELDLLAIFKVMQQDIITGMGDFEGTPEQYIDKILKDISGTEEEGIVMKDKVEKVCKPRGGEKQSDFISRCIREQMHGGKTQDEAKGMCYGIWRGEKAKQGIFKSLNAAIKRIIKRII